MAMEYGWAVRGILTSENGATPSQKATECTFTKTETVMKESGKVVSNMEKAVNYSQTEMST